MSLSRSGRMTYDRRKYGQTLETRIINPSINSCEIPRESIMNSINYEQSKSFKISFRTNAINSVF